MIIEEYKDIIKDKRLKRYPNIDLEIEDRRETSFMEHMQIDNISRIKTLIIPTTPMTPISTNGLDGFSTSMVSSFS